MSLVKAKAAKIPSPAQSIGLKLLRHAFSAYFLVTLSVTSYQMVQEYRSEKASLFSELEKYHSTFTLSLGQALWEFNSSQMSTIIDGIRANDLVLGVRITDPELQAVAESGAVWPEPEDVPNPANGGFTTLRREGESGPLSEVYAFHFPVRFGDGREGLAPRLVGWVYLYTDSSVVLARVKAGFILLIVNSVIKTFALWLIFLWVSQRLVIRPLNQLARDISQIESLDTHKMMISPSLLSRQDEIGYLSQTFAAMLQETLGQLLTIQDLNNTLEAKVAERTKQLSAKSRDLETLFASIPIGVMTIGENGICSAEHSPIACDILGVDTISGRSLSELLLRRSSFSSDQSSLIISTINACIFEDDLNFDLNANNLLSTTELRRSDGNRHLELSWSYVLNEAHLITKILLCLKDSTELKALAQKSAAHAFEITLISEVIRLPRGLAAEALAGLQSLLDESERCLHAPVTDMAQLARLLHTIKGNARSLQLSSLADLSHDAEELLNAPAQDGLVLVIEEAKALISHYLSHALSLRLIAEPSPTFALNLSDLLAISLSTLPALAASLGKAPPVVTIKAPELGFRQSHSHFLNDIFGHLFRNSLDHGIEPQSERLAAGKAGAGQILITARVSDDHRDIIVDYEDDGRGLDLENIRQRLSKNGQLSASEAAVLSSSELANTIFSQGFSTQGQVSQISGRGVGLDAVRHFLSAKGGEVSLISANKFALRIRLPIHFCEHYPRDARAS